MTKFKIRIQSLGLAAFFLGLGTSGYCSDPFTTVTADESLYQRVKKLGDAGLLDSRDKAALDQGMPVSRLELAFDAEEAGARLYTPKAKEGTSPAPLLAQALPGLPAQGPNGPGPATGSGEELRLEIRELLKELSEEAAYLRAHTSLQGARLAQREDELDKLRPLQDELDSLRDKTDLSSGVPNVSTKGRFRVENLNLSGIAPVNAMRIQDETGISMWSDLGGKGSLFFGIAEVQSLSDPTPSSSPVSFYTFTPAINVILDGPLGRWSTNFVVESYQPDTSLGDFARGAAPTALRRFIDPVNVANWNEEQDTKTWDDYMGTIGYFPMNYLAMGRAQSAGDRVFDGLYAIGTGVPLLASDARVNFMLGRMGNSPTQSQRWEQEVKLAQPWADGLFRTSLAGIWVNDHFGTSQPGAIDLRNYAVEFMAILKPVYIGAEGAYSYLYDGPNYAPALESGGGQAFAAYYPFVFYYSAIGDGYSNFQSKVMMGGVHFDQYGQDFDFNSAGDMYGAVGEVDNLISDRYGWRVNLGWDGRLQDWMKDWPGFLDDFILNLDVAQKNEYAPETSPEGYNVIEPFNMITFYYPDDEGLWGRDFWGGWGPGQSGADPVRQAYIGNIQALRNDGNSNWDDVRHQYMLTSERIPLILPVANEPVQDINGQPITVAGGPNAYTSLTHLKAYHYLTLTAKLRLNKMAGISNPLYGSFFFTDNVVSGTATDPTLSAMPDPNRPGQTLAEIPNLFEQRVAHFALMWQFTKGVNLMGEYGLETWKSDYTFPLVNYRTDCIGGGMAYDLPWGGGKFEFRYKHLVFTDADVAANSYQGDQVFSTLMLLF